jgi:hypothetical protein
LHEVACVQNCRSNDPALIVLPPDVPGAADNSNENVPTMRESVRDEIVTEPAPTEAIACHREDPTLKKAPAKDDSPTFAVPMAAVVRIDKTRPGGESAVSDPPKLIRPEPPGLSIPTQIAFQAIPSICARMVPLAGVPGTP